MTSFKIGRPILNRAPAVAEVKIGRPIQNRAEFKIGRNIYKEWPLCIVCATITICAAWVYYCMVASSSGEYNFVNSTGSLFEAALISTEAAGRIWFCCFSYAKIFHFLGQVWSIVGMSTIPIYALLAFLFVSEKVK